jgi:predicted RNA-binding Zn ribbon-like protein
METAPQNEPFEFSGGALCLDFANTLGNRPQGKGETLHVPRDLARWGVAAGLLDPDAGRRSVAGSSFTRAIAFREGLYRIFSARASARSPERSDLDLLNGYLGRALKHLRLEPDGSDYRWDWAGSPEPVDRLLWSVARSAAQLLTSPELDRIRECASDRCSWLFLDFSRSRRRRWCDMKTCGNRAKARRHYRRRKSTTEARDRRRA